MTSPPAIEPRPTQMGKLIEFLKNWTEPSARSEFTPPDMFSDRSTPGDFDHYFTNVVDFKTLFPLRIRTIWLSVFVSIIRLTVDPQAISMEFYAS